MPAGANQRCGRIQDFLLPPGAHLHGLLAPIRDGGFLLPEHSLPGTGRVHQHPVEETGKPLRQGGRMLVGHQGVGNGHALDVPGENFRPLGIDLVAEQKALPPHPSGDLGGLSAGCGAQVADPLPRLRVEQRHRRHGAGLLKVIGPRLMKNMQAGSGSRVVIVPHRLPRHRLSHEGQRRNFPLQGIEPQRHRPGAVQAVKIAFIFVSQLALHALQKGFRQHTLPPKS